MSDKSNVKPRKTISAEQREKMNAGRKKAMEERKRKKKKKNCNYRKK